MRVLDLFCGRWGWSRAFAARGWECWGIDLVPSPLPAPNAKFSCLDILDLSSNDLLRFQPNFIVASSPCEEFSVHGMKHFHPNPKYPEMGIKLFNHTRAICEASGLPYVMENVRAAQKFVGNAVHHCGSFYLWGNFGSYALGLGQLVEPLKIPRGIIKGMTRKAMGQREHKGKPGWNTKNEAASRRQNAEGCASIAATIPLELANCICDYAENLLTRKNQVHVAALKQRAGGAHLEETHIEEK